MFSSDKWFGASAGFYPETIDQSLLFNDDDNAYLNKTFSGAGNTKTWTWSAWIKRANLNVRQNIFGQLDVSVTNRQNYAYFHEDGHIWFVNYTTSGYNYRLTTNQVFRDTTNWYHLVFVQDTTQSTSSDRVKIYVNGTQITSFSTATYPSLNFDGWINQNTGQGIQFGVGKVVPYSSVNQPLDGYMAEVNFVDGTALDPTYFGETKNGVWIPKAISGVTYGTNGFRLTFADSSALGDDTSGNGNDFTSSGLASTDVVLDSPTNNFCTINGNRESLVYNGSVTFSEGNLQSVDAGTTYSLHWTGTFGMSTGKWYWEVLAHTMGGSSANIGICNEVHRVGTAGTGVFYGADGKRNPVTYFTGQTTYGASYTSGDIIGVAFDADNETVTFYKNNSSQGAVGSVLTTANGGYFPSVGDGQNATTYKYVANFGQDSSFAGNKTAQGNTDGNGQGDFYYSPPSGYLALCSANLPDPTIGPNSSNGTADEFFNTVLYTANNQTAQSITGVGFRPDWLWFKQRSRADAHALYNTSMGIDISMRITTDSEYDTTASATGVTALGSDGFTLGTDQQAWVNYGSDSMVAWLWKANGGTTSSNSDGSITSTVQANTTAGFSIVTTTGNGSSGATIGHGLNATPKWIISKQRNDANHWAVYHHEIGTGNEVYLSLTQQQTSSNFWITDPTTSVFSVSNSDYVNENNSTYVFYCFAEVEGYSKFGSYTGNGSTDGTFVYTGFRPSWVMVKRTDSSNYWMILDDVRETANPENLGLYPNLSDAEGSFGNGTGIDFVSNGFKHRDNVASTNASSGTYIYMAFAKQPFKFSNAR